MSEMGLFRRETMGVPSTNLAAQIRWMLAETSRPGLWYEPWDFSTLFQDSAGTIPVTAVEQPVGLMLDKSGKGNHLTLTDAVIRVDDLGRYYIYFNGTSAWGEFPTEMFARTNGLVASMAVQFDKVTSLSFPLFVSTSASQNGTLFGTGIYSSPPNMIAVGRRITSDNAKQAQISSLEPGSVFTATSVVDHENDKLSTFLDGSLITALSPFQGVGLTGYAPLVARVGRFGNGPSGYWSGRLYGMLIRSGLTSDSERKTVDRYMSNVLTNPSPIPPPDPEPLPAEINVFLVWGQSNADGRVPIADGPSWVNGGLVPSVNVWNGTAITDLKLSNIGKAGNGTSWVQANSSNKFAFSDVALKVIAETMSNVVACQVTSGGTALDPTANSRGSWCPDYDLIADRTVHLLEDFITRVEALKSYCTLNGVTLNFKAIIWHQGESDRGAGPASSYLTRLTELILKVRQASGNPALPVIYGTVPSDSLWYSATIRQAHLDFAASDGNAYCRDNNGLTFLADGLHFDSSSCVVFGEWAAGIVGGLP